MGCVFGLIVLAIAAFVAWKLVPVKVKSTELRQEIIDQARSAGNRPEGKIRYNILKKAEELDLPLTDKELKIRLSSERVKIEASYTVPVDFPGYTYQWKFHHVAENPLF